MTSDRGGTLRFVLGDQVTRSLSALEDLDPARDTVLMAEVQSECTYVKHHPKKIVLVLSAMRHFAAALEAEGVRVRYVRLDDPENTGSLRGELVRAVEALRPGRVVATECGEWRLEEDMRGWQDAIRQRDGGVEVEIRDDTRFLCRRQEFRAWAGGRKGLRMEFFYREMRARYGLLMEGAEGEAAPAGGRWNYDPENRKPLPKSIAPPVVAGFVPDETTRAVMDLVAERFADHFGAVDGFNLPVTPEQAGVALDDFITGRLAQFGDWQDTMKTGATTMFHALVSTSLNTGLLSPLDACRAAEAAWRDGRAPLNAVEGFIRQILGWREYVRGVYWLKVPDYRHMNGLGAYRRMPWLYWSGETRMNCMHQAINDTKTHAYAHHIQRLMVMGNFALLAGLHPDDVDEWYMVVYADAYEWVEMPNVRGMALHADGGIMGSKPYAASGAYINRMSDYCRGCYYDVKSAMGPRACPFNALYWDFIARHADRFGTNPRMSMPVRTWGKMAASKQVALRAQASQFLAAMDAGEDV